MNSKRRVVITGFGVITSCGSGWEPYWDAAVHGRSMIRSSDSLGLNSASFKYAGMLADFDPKQFIENRKSIKLMSREIQMAVAASRLALRLMAPWIWPGMSLNGWKKRTCCAEAVGASVRPPCACRTPRTASRSPRGVGAATTAASVARGTGLSDLASGLGWSFVRATSLILIS